jgi:hypothetical protein
MLDWVGVSIIGPVELHHPWLEQLAWVSQIVLAVLATFGTIFAYLTVRDATRSRHASLILELERRWDGDDIKAARALFAKTREEITKKVSEDHPLTRDGAKEEKQQEEWTKRLAQMRKEDPDQYRKLMSMWGFFETVGLTVRRKYILEDDAFGLFKGPILYMHTFMRPHTEQRANEMSVPDGFLENALYLCDLAAKNEAG